MRGLWSWAAAAAVLAILSGCSGGSGTAVPPITREGVSLRVAEGTGAEVVTIRGGAGPNTLYIEDGAFRFLGTETRESDSVTRVFRSSDRRSVARLATPVDFKDIGLLGLVYERNGVLYVSQGVFGRFTRVADMPGTGSASFSGREAQASWVDVGDASDLDGGETIVEVNFGTGRVSALLDFTGSAGSQSAPIDMIELNNMRISGNRFAGGSLTSRKGGAKVAAFSDPSALSSSGVFAGPGAAELGGVFQAKFPEDRLLLGRYLAARD